MNTQFAPSRRFDVAVSFPGEHRAYVEQVSQVLGSLYGRDRVLYDKFHDDELARPDIDVYLPTLYRTQSELLVLFLCPEFAQKRWCRLEWRHIRQLLATEDEHRIMFLSIGNPGDLSALGVLRGDGWKDVSGMGPHEAALSIVKRLRINQQGVAITPIPSASNHGPQPGQSASRSPRGFCYTALHHVSLPVRNISRSIHFYKEIIGLKIKTRPPFFNFEGAWFELPGEQELHLLQTEDATYRDANSAVDFRDTHFALRVDDLPAAYAYFGDKVKIVNSSQALSILRYQGFYILDPDFHLIEINTFPTRVEMAEQ